MLDEKFLDRLFDALSRLRERKDLTDAERIFLGKLQEMEEKIIQKVEA